MTLDNALNQPLAVADLLLAGLMIAFAAAMIASPPGAIGDAVFFIAAAVLIVFAIEIAALAFRCAKPDRVELGYRRRLDLALIALALTAAYFAVMQMGF